MLNEKMNTNKKGMTLIELLAVLGVGGGMVAGALLLVGNVMEERDIKQHSENISAVFNNMQNLFSDEAMGSATMENLVTAGVFPNSLRISQTTAGDVRTAGGGAVEVTAVGDGFKLSYEKIKAATCVEVIKGQRRVGWDTYKVEAGSTTVDADSSGIDFASVSVATIAGHCDTSDDDWVSVGFYIE